MVFGREVLGELIGNIFSSLLKVQAQLILLDTAAHPVETHVKIFGALLAHVADEDAVGGCAVIFDRGGRLRVTHLDEGCAYGNSLLSVEGNPSSFGFSCLSHDGADDLTFGEYWSVRGRSETYVGWWCIVA